MSRTCAANGLWPTTDAGHPADVPCGGANPPGSVMRRWCRDDGSKATWESPLRVDKSMCRMCPADGEWHPTMAGKEAHKACDPRRFKGGLRRRTCGDNGVWQGVRDGCQPFTCAAVGGWPEARVGERADRPCGHAKSGTMYRTCGAKGLWGSVDQSECAQKSCMAQDGWPDTEINTWGSKPCDAGYQGAVLRYCQLSQANGNAPGIANWGRVDRKCTAVEFPPSAQADADLIREGEAASPNPDKRFCPHDGLWKPVAAGMLATRACDEKGHLRTRQCNADATWGKKGECGPVGVAGALMRARKDNDIVVVGVAAAMLAMLWGTF